MKTLKKLYNKVLGKNNQGSPCFVLGKEANITAVVPGTMKTNLESAVEIEYLWKDNTKHTFIANQDNFISTPDGAPLFAVDVGKIYAERVTKATPVGSESLYRIIKSNVCVQLADYLEELKEEGQFKWQKIIIIAVIIVAVFWLWKTGFITGVMGDVIPTTTPPVPAQEAPVINPKPEGL